MTEEHIEREVPLVPKIAAVSIIAGDALEATACAPSWSVSITALKCTG